MGEIQSVEAKRDLCGLSVSRFFDAGHMPYHFGTSANPGP
jgi:hypothetical protein